MRAALGRRHRRRSGRPAARLPRHARLPAPAAGPGWALVGDAGYFKDPLTAHGITDALRDAEFLARAVVDGGRARSPATSRRGTRCRVPLLEVAESIAAYGWDLTRDPRPAARRERRHEPEVAVVRAFAAAATGPRTRRRPAHRRDGPRPSGRRPLGVVRAATPRRRAPRPGAERGDVAGEVLRVGAHPVDEARRPARLPAQAQEVEPWAVVTPRSCTGSPSSPKRPPRSTGSRRNPVAQTTVVTPAPRSSSRGAR